MQRSLRKLKDAVFAFLNNQNVHYENNASERAIKKAKIKMNVRLKPGTHVKAALQQYPVL